MKKFTTRLACIIGIALFSHFALGSLSSKILQPVGHTENCDDDDDDDDGNDGE